MTLNTAWREQRIIFAGTPEFAAHSLNALLNAGGHVIAVYTQPDRLAGRGQQRQISPVKRLAQTHALPVMQPESFKKDPLAVAQLHDLQADLMIVVAYGLLLPATVLNAPRLGCLNVHASLLPRWRGAAPIQRAVLAGDVESGVCIMQMDIGLDTGPVYHRVTTPLLPTETGGSLHDRLAELGAQALLDALPGICAGACPAVAQDDTHAIYAHKLTKDEARIVWTQSAVQIERQIRAFNPSPVAHTTLDGVGLRIWDAQLPADFDSSAPAALPGTIIAADKTGIRVATGDRDLLITRLQPAGKKPLTAADYLNARRVDGLRCD